MKTILTFCFILCFSSVIAQTSVGSNVDTLIIKNKAYYIYSNSESVFQIICLHDTLKREFLLSECKYTDFNNDGYTDVISIAMDGSRNPTNYLFLFNKTTNCFNEIKGAEKFPEPERVGENLYYSFSTAGCASMNQMEKLFYIKNDSAIQVASAYIVGCEHDEMAKGNYIYSHINGKEKLVAKYDYNSDVGLLKFYKKNIRKFK